VNGHVRDVEERLRGAYRAAADTIEPGSMRDVRDPLAVIAPDRAGAEPAGIRRVMRGRVLLPLAAAAAVVAVAVAVPALQSGVPSAAPGRTARPTAGTRPPLARPTVAAPQTTSDAPPFFVTVSDGGASVEVYRTTTAQVAATVAVPADGDNFYGIAPTANPLTYVVALGRAYTCGTHLYTLQLTGSGQLASYTPLSVPAIPEDVFSLAVTPDSRFLGYAGEYCDGPEAGTGDIGFVNLATGAVSRWTAPGNEDIGSVSLSADGSQLGFVVQQTQLYAPLAGLLATDAPAGTVAERAQVVVAEQLAIQGSQVVPTGTVASAAALTPDGGTLYVCGSTPDATPDPLLAYSGGKVTASRLLAGSGPCTLSVDPSGTYLLAQTAGAGSATMLQLVDLATGTVTSLPTQDISAQSGPVTW
jgi:hypothetical protein